MNKYVLEERNEHNDAKFCKDMIYTEDKDYYPKNQYIMKNDTEYFAQVYDYKNWDEPQLFIIIKDFGKKYSYKKIVKCLKFFFSDRKEIKLSIATCLTALIIDDDINVKSASYSNFGKNHFSFENSEIKNIIIDGVNVKYRVGSESEINCDFVSQNISDNKIIEKFLEIKKDEYIYFKINEIKNIEYFEFCITTLII